MSIGTIKKNKNNNNSDSKINNSLNYSSSSSSIFEDINFSALFNPHDKYINCGEKTSYNLMSYDLGIFSSLSSICKNLNIPYDQIISSDNSSQKLKNNNEKNNENIQGNINNGSNNKDNVLSDSILQILLSDNDSGIKKNNQKETTVKKINKSEVDLNEEDLDELLKDYPLMELEKND